MSFATKIRMVALTGSESISVQWHVLTPSSLLLQSSFLPRLRRLVWDLHSLAIRGRDPWQFYSDQSRALFLKSLVISKP